MRLNLTREYVASLHTDTATINAHSGQAYTAVEVYKALDLTHSPQDIAKRVIADLEAGIAFHTPSKTFAVYAVGLSGKPDWHSISFEVVKGLVKAEIEGIRHDITIHRHAVAAGIQTGDTDASYAERVFRYLDTVDGLTVTHAINALKDHGTVKAPKGRVSAASQALFDRVQKAKVQ